MNLVFRASAIFFLLLFSDNLNQSRFTNKEYKPIEESVGRSFIERTLNKNLSCIQFESVKKKNIPKIKSVLIHKKFNKVLSISFYYKLTSANCLDLYIVMPYEGSTEIQLSIKESLENLNQWAISIYDSVNDEIKPFSIKKIDKTQELEVIFGARKIRFGEIYLCKFDFNNKKIDINSNCYLKLYQYDKYAYAPIDISLLCL